MKGIKGQLSSLPLTDLMQWIEMNRKTGVLLINREDTSRCFCFKDGGILFASSSEDGGRLGDYLSSEAQVPKFKLEEILAESRNKGTSFVKNLTDCKLVPREFMKAIIEHVTESVIMDVLSWSDAAFHFIEQLPQFADGSGISLNTNHVVFESVRKYDESMRQKGAGGP